MKTEEENTQIAKAMTEMPDVNRAAERGIAAIERMIGDWKATTSWDGAKLNESVFAVGAGIVRSLFEARVIALTHGGSLVCTSAEGLLYCVAQQLQVAGLKIVVDPDTYDTRGVTEVLDRAQDAVVAASEAVNATKN